MLISLAVTLAALFFSHGRSECAVNSVQMQCVVDVVVSCRDSGCDFDVVASLP